VLTVQQVGDRLRRHALIVERENPADDLRFPGIDETARADRLARFIPDGLRAVAVAAAPGDEPAADLSNHAPAGLLPEVLEEDFILPPGNGREQAAGLLGQVGARGDREHADHPEPEALQGMMHLALITPQPVLGFDDDRINNVVLGNLKEPDVGGALVDRPGNLLIGVDVTVEDVTCKAGRGFAAERNLVIERAHMLALARIPGIDRRFQHALGSTIAGASPSLPVARHPFWYRSWASISAKPSRSWRSAGGS
jgi:hypothetical protein